MFGALGSWGVVRNLGIEGGSVTGNSHAGALVGYNGGTISECYATRTVVNASPPEDDSGRGIAGGLVGVSGLSQRDVICCYAIDLGPEAGSAEGHYEGRVISRTTTVGSISESYVTQGVVTATGLGIAGGLMGINSGSISGCSATTSAVEAVGRVLSATGGLVGENDGSISGSYATGFAYATGTTSGTTGGLVGENDGSISGCYATGTVRATGTTSSLAGGLWGIVAVR